jgi:hypothetical protein
LLSRSHWPHPALLIAYLAAWAGAAFLPLPRNDLPLFFWPAADMAAGGQPLMAYAPGGQALYPDANPPLSLLPLTAVELLTRWWGWLANEQLHRAVTYTVFSVIVLLMAREGVEAIDRLRGATLTPVQQLLAFGALALAPPIWQSIAGFGHVEQPIEAWMVLLAARFTAEQRPRRAGVALGLAVLARSPAMLFWIPLALAARSRSARAAGLLTAVAAGTVIAVMLPFLVADRADVLHSLVYYRGALGIGAGSIWSLTRGTALGDIAQHLDLFFATLLALTLNAWLAAAPGGLNAERLYAGLAVAAASFALLAKAVWPYYFFEVYVFTAIWVLGRRAPTRLLVSAVTLGVVVALGLLAEVGSTTGLSLPLVRLEGTVMFLVLAVAMGLFVARASRPAPAG